MAGTLYAPIPSRYSDHGGFGRNVRHDPRSWAYRVGRGATPKSVEWPRHIEVLDQGQVGSCTGEAKVGQLGTGPFWDALTDSQRRQLGQPLAVHIYSEGTKLDDAPDWYNPETGVTDTGCDGLSVSKVSVTEGYESGFQHAMSLDEAHAAIQDRPFILGTLFYESMETPDRNGLVTIGGQVLGGHEYECFKYDEAADVWWFYNSWSDGWGKDGTFGYTSAVLRRLLAMQGDITVGVPLDRPAPVPVPSPPQPEPAPAPADTVPVPSRLAAEFDIWAKSPHGYHASTVLAKDWQSFRRG